jgi:DNA-binding transcriptional LysR family regulator
LLNFFEQLATTLAMKLDQLEYFVATARRQHIGQAALFLNISPSAISHSISALEAEFGKQLFEKHGRQIKLTHHGKLLLDRAEFLLSEADRVREELASGEMAMRGHYRIAATHTLCAEILTPVWMDLQEKNPALTSTLQSLRSGEIVSRASSGEIDLGLCFSPHPGPNHEQAVIHHGRLVFCFGKRHPFLKERRIEALAEYPAIAAMTAQGIENCETHPSFQTLGLRPKTINLFDSYDVAIQALKSQRVWTLLPDFLAYSRSADIETYVPRGWEADYKVAAVWPKFRIRTQALDLVIENTAAMIQTATKRSRL